MSDNEMRKSMIEMRRCSKFNQAMRSLCAAFGHQSIIDLSDWRLTLGRA
ncbi:hypothetical protein J7U46_20415 [Pelomonas sp. V22]|nr:hypothetical protein [Pelomonas sp. V22]MDI4635440.1 hypothetical protein [Pelomonas sp. V22]